MYNLNVSRHIFTSFAKRALFITFVLNLTACFENAEVTSSGGIGPSFIVLSGTPQSISNQSSLSIGVGGFGVVAYKYKLGPPSVDCTDSAGYNSGDDISVDPSIDLFSLSDGQYTLCVVGKDLIGWRDDNTATILNWTIDTVPPPSVVNLTGVPSPSINNITNPTIVVSGIDITSYKYQLSIAADCTNNALYSSDRSVSIPITDLLGNNGTGDGVYTLCVIGADAAGNWQSTAMVASTSWTKDTLAPAILNVTSPTTDGTYINPAVINVHINWSENVTVTGTPTLELETGGVDTIVNYSFTSGSQSQFNYTVGTSDFNSDLNYTSTTALALGGGTIQDLAGNTAILTLPLLGDSSSLAGSKNLNVVMTVTVDPTYTSGPNWNDYVLNDGPDDYTATNTVCSGAITNQFYNHCLHAGQMKKVEVPGINSCTGLTLFENLDVFDWVCKDLSGTAIFYTKGFKLEKGLRDLIMPSGGWQSNFVTIIEPVSSTTIAMSNPASWWTNPVSPLPTSMASAQPLSAPGTVYYANGDLNTMGYNIQADKISIVTLGSSRLLYTDNSGTQINNCNTTSGTITSPTNASIICGGGPPLLNIWVEASLVGNNGTHHAHSALTAASWRFSRIHRTSIENLSSNTEHHAILFNRATPGSGSNLISDTSIFKASGGLEITNTTHNTVINLKVADINSSGSNTSGVNLNSSANENRFYWTQISNHTGSDPQDAGILVDTIKNIFVNTKITNITNAAIKLTGTNGHGNIFSQTVIAATQSHSLILNGSDNNIFSHLTIANSPASGIHVPGGNTNNNGFNSVAITNVYNGIELLLTTTGTLNIFNNMAIGDYTGKAINLVGANFTSDFTGYLLAGSSPMCIAAASGTDLNTACQYGPGFIFSPISTNIASDFVGPVTAAGDAINNAESTGTASYSILALTIENWLNFDHIFRGWGKDSVLFDASSQGVCNTASCRIWDWRLKTSGSILLNTSDNGASPNAPFTTGACAAPVDGNRKVVFADATYTKTFLQNAIEILGDKIGNDNGLCESSEHCIYAPNIGAYQGEGINTTSSCTTSGTVSGATIFNYQSNGI